MPPESPKYLFGVCFWLSGGFLQVFQNVTPESFLVVFFEEIQGLGVQLVSVFSIPETPQIRPLAPTLWDTSGPKRPKDLAGRGVDIAVWLSTILCRELLWERQTPLNKTTIKSGPPPPTIQNLEKS